jgi:hypothetical protein
LRAARAASQERVEEATLEIGNEINEKTVPPRLTPT